MAKYSVETGLTKEGIPIIKCSPGFYDELINECRHLINGAKANKELKPFIKKFPAIGALASMPTMEESIDL